MKAYFKNVLEIGDLSLDKVLFEFEKLPIIFVCRDREEFYYFCLCTDMIIDNTWMLTKVSRGLLLKLLDNEISILDIFKMSGDEVIIINQHGENISCEKKKFQDIPEDELPEENEKLENPCLADYRERLQDEMYKKKSVICEYEGKVSDLVQDLMIFGFETGVQEHEGCMKTFHFRNTIVENRERSNSNIIYKFPGMNRKQFCFVEPIKDDIYYFDIMSGEEDKYKKRNLKFQEKSFFIESVESAGV